MARGGEWAAAGVSVGDEKMDGIGADVEDAQTHGGQLIGGSGRHPRPVVVVPDCRMNAVASGSGAPRMTIAPAFGPARQTRPQGRASEGGAAQPTIHAFAKAAV